ncbi:winged helix-turn-helix domain-containing protein [Arthrobacter caoxuetaonis]|uniref:winged helix-turn-helix domain-containing protein n=1 Tax=Arthrobacter caoxuetaonis TaxID=2886935 RepID=UPI001D151D42|nr:crosslink repair DNA glycosylase YcaQ family protein [Arthrobacter caoxuetaonis]MCC3280985.1 winged helix DNA-binding domain-containing protein [Arthrobacter caoxuetaonis]
MPAALTLDQARRAVLCAQQFAKARPASPTPGQVGRVFDSLALLQIDSVNVLARSHYLPHFSRLGAYDRTVLDGMSSRHPRRMMEYWAHEASYIHPDLFADLRLWKKRSWAGSVEPEELRRSVSDALLALLEDKHPLTARQAEMLLGHAADREKTHWGWNWSVVKRVLEDLFEQGIVTSAGRTAQFERLYAPTAAVHPQGPASLEDGVDRGEALLRLTERAARSLGVGTANALADYFRLPVQDTLAAARTLSARGTLEETSVAGWKAPVFLHAAARIPRRCHGRGLLSPFDSLVFDRRRLRDLFGIDYRIEIYTPVAKRRFGYYVLPFLLRERIAARVDLKADRARGVLLVQSAHLEVDAPDDTAVELAAELVLMARWLDLGEVMVRPVGNLAPALKLAVSRE